VIERKPYIVGLQQSTIVTFFDAFAVKDLQKTSASYLTAEVEKGYLKAIDLEQLEIQGSW
jgi:hypothetical protein